MGMEQLSADPNIWVALARKAVDNRDEQQRKAQQMRRVQLYFCEYELIAQQAIEAIFQEATVAAQLCRLIPLVGGSSFSRLVADEVAGPIYSSAPQRRVYMPGELEAQVTGVTLGQSVKPPPPSEAQQAWNRLADELELTETMDQAARLITPTDRVFLLPRVITEKTNTAPVAPTNDGDGELDLMTADMVSVIPDPLRPRRALAHIYQQGDAKDNHYILWDELRWISFHTKGTTPFEVNENPYKVNPIIEVARRRGKPGRYWNPGRGKDLEAQSLLSFFCDLISLRKVKNQSHIQLVNTGDETAFTKNQVPDDLNVLQGQLTAINLESDPGKIQAFKEANENRVAGAYGISRDRLNLKSTVASDEALKERTTELAQSMRRAELRLFAVAQAISQVHREWKVPAAATATIDFGYVNERTSRKDQLDIRAEEKRQGIRSPVDDVLEDNPEFGNNRQLALAYLEEKARERAVVVSMQRALNAPADAAEASATPETAGPSEDAVGQSPQANGANGPKVREGEMTKDEAAADAGN